jgi:GNAT superfamily N-acetyltransferase
LLIAAYLVTAYFGWRRTLIETEVWALYHAGQSLTDQLQSIRSDLVHPPLMYMIERIWLGAFGQTDRAAKALSLVVNLPTLVLFSWLASRITRRWRLASALLSTIYLSVGSAPDQVRMYGLGILLTVAAMVLWEKWVENPTNGKLAGWGLLLTLLIYTHLFGSLIVIAFVVANWMYGPRHWAFTFVSAVPGLAFLPWFLYVLPEYLHRGLGENLTWVEKNPILGLAGVPSLFMGFLRVSSSTNKILVLAAILAHLVLLGIAWRGLGRVWPPHRQTRHDAQWLWASLLLASIPILFLLLFSVLVAPAFHPRFILGALPAYWLFIILLADLDWRRGRILLYAVFVPWAAVGVARALVYARTPSAAYQAAVVIAREHRPGDVVLCKSPCNELYWEFTRRLGRTESIQALADTSAQQIAPLDVLPRIPIEKVDLGSSSRVWFVFPPGQATGLESEFLQRQGFTLHNAYPAGRPCVILLTRPQSQAASP